MAKLENGDALNDGYFTEIAHGNNSWWLRNFAGRHYSAAEVI